jgi:integrator complex subunit 6
MMNLALNYLLHFQFIILGMKIEDEIEVIDEKSGAKTGWQNVRRMIYVPRTNQKGFAGGFWPIPEAYYPDQSLPSLPSRSAHPNVKLMCQPSEPLVVENFPFDKYELEPSPLTQYIIGRKQPAVCWQVRVGSLKLAFKIFSSK